MFSEKDLLFSVPESSVATPGAGLYLKKILILIKSEPHFTGSKVFLEKVLSAVQIDLNQDVYWWSLDSTAQFPFLAELKNRAPEQVLVFGFTPADLHLRAEISLYSPVFFYGSMFLFADSLSQLEPDRDRKTRLWHALKAIYT